MLTTLAAATLLAQAATPAPSPQPECSYDLEAMLELDQQAFDQDMDGGWRPLAARDGCELAAAELIRAWRHEKRAHDGILYWHEGQMRAFAGQAEEAVALFELTYNPPEFDADFGWNHYVSGTIAFLIRDREHLHAAMDRLRALPAPDNLIMTRPDGTTFTMAWPPNLNVLEAFDRCWERSYAEAYGTAECHGVLTPTAPS